MNLGDESNTLLPPLYNESFDNPFFPNESDSLQPRKTSLSPAPPRPSQSSGFLGGAIDNSLGGELGKLNDSRAKTGFRISSPASLRMSWDPGPIHSASSQHRSRICNARHSFGDIGAHKVNGKQLIPGQLDNESTDNESLNHTPNFNLNAVKSRKSIAKMRAVSVYSPSSFESSEISASRPPRYVPRRRASVPAIGLSCLPDKQMGDSLRSPEFSKAFRELNGAVSPQGSNTLR